MLALHEEASKYVHQNHHVLCDLVRRTKSTRFLFLNAFFYMKKQEKRKKKDFFAEFGEKI
jgi:hypothetical protein